MFIRVNPDGYGDGLLGDPPAGFKKGGLPVGEDDAKHLLTILEGRSLVPAVPGKGHGQSRHHGSEKILEDRDEREQPGPEAPQARLHSGGGRMTGGTIDRWTRTIYMVEAPGLRDHTRLEYAIHECVHLFAHPHAPTPKLCPAPCIGTFQHEFGTGFGEGLTQVVTEDIMREQNISRFSDRPYEDFAAIMRKVIEVFGLDAMARAYFFGDVKSLRTSMEARWGTNWHAIAGHTTAGDRKRALAQIEQLEAAHKKRIEDLIRQSPKGDFPTPSSRVRSMA